MRVFESTGLLLRRLRWDEWLILAVYALLVAWPRMLEVLSSKKASLGPMAQEHVALFVIGLMMGFAVVAFSPGTRFRNVWFSAGWLVLSSWLFVKSHGIVIEPLVLLLFYHGLRWHFWRRFGREWIPATVSRTGYDRDYYRLEKRYSSFDDIAYTKFLFRVGMVLVFVTCILPARIFSAADPNCQLPCLYRPTSKP